MFLPLAETAARAACCGGSTGNQPRRIDSAARGFRGSVRPRAGFRRRPSARASVSAGARRVARSGEGGGAAAWVRQCGTRLPLAQRLGDSRRWLLDVLSAQFRALRRGRHRDQSGVSPAPMIFRKRAGFRRAVPALSRRPAGRRPGDVPSGLCRCRLERLDPLTDPARARIRLSRRRCLSRRCWRRTGYAGVKCVEIRQVVLAQTEI